MWNTLFLEYSQRAKRFAWYPIDEAESNQRYAPPKEPWSDQSTVHERQAPWTERNDVHLHSSRAENPLPHRYHDQLEDQILPSAEQTYSAPSTRHDLHLQFRSSSSNFQSRGRFGGDEMTGDGPRSATMLGLRGSRGYRPRPAGRQWWPRGREYRPYDYEQGPARPARGTMRGRRPYGYRRAEEGFRPPGCAAGGPTDQGLAGAGGERVGTDGLAQRVGRSDCARHAHKASPTDETMPWPRSPPALPAPLSRGPTQTTPPPPDPDTRAAAPDGGRGPAHGGTAGEDGEVAGAAGQRPEVDDGGEAGGLAGYKAGSVCEESCGGSDEGSDSWDPELSSDLVLECSESELRETRSVTNSHEQSRSVTNSHGQSRTVTGSHEQSRSVTFSHEQSRSVTVNRTYRRLSRLL